MSEAIIKARVLKARIGLWLWSWEVAFTVHRDMRRKQRDAEVRRRLYS
jgi:hypothetical protein